MPGVGALYTRVRAVAAQAPTRCSGTAMGPSGLCMQSLLKGFLQILQDYLKFRLNLRRSLYFFGPDHAVPVDNEVRPLREAVLVPDAVAVHSIPFEIREQRKTDAPLLGPRAVRPRRIRADRQHARAFLLETSGLRLHLTPLIRAHA